MSFDAAGTAPPFKVPELKKGLVRLLAFAAVVAILIITLPGLGSIRSRLSHGAPGWIAIAAAMRLCSAFAYVETFKAIFAPQMPLRLAYQIGMSEIGVNALVPAGGTGGLAIGGWVLHRRGMSTDEVVKRSAEFFVFTSAFNIGGVAVLGWLAVIGVLNGPSSVFLMLVPAIAATALIVAAIAIAPRLSALQADLMRKRAHSIGWWSLEALVLVGTGAEGAISVFKQRQARALLGGFGYLAFDIATLWAAVHAFHGQIALAPLAMAYLVGQLAGEIPIPGGIGVVDGGLIGAMIVYGLHASVATASSLAYRAIALGIPTLFGGLAAVSLIRTVHGWEPAPEE